MRVPGDIVAFLESRLAEREVLAKASVWGDREDTRWKSVWSDDKGGLHREERISVVDEEDDYLGTLIYDEGGHDEDVAEHIVTWQPAHVLEHIATQRRIIDRYKSMSGEKIISEPMQIAMYVVLGEVLIDLAAPYREHPDWDPEWEVEG